MRQWIIAHSSFLPWPLTVAAPRPGALWEFPAVVAFFDIAGFTTMSERLGSHGPEGAEQLHEILNEFFGFLIDAVAREGGHTVAFAGDSATAVFASQADTDDRARRAAAAVQDLASGFRRRLTLAGPIDVDVKIGIGAGEWRCRVLGDADRRRAVFDGSAIEAAVEAEHGAIGGEILEHSSVRESPPESAELHAGPFPSPPDVDAFLHPMVVERLGVSGPDRMAEHRDVTTLFCGYDLQHRSDEREFLIGALDIADTYGGYLSDVEHGDKGAKFLMLFGAPVGHADFADRAMSAALACRSLRGATTRIGLGTGRCFTGLIGNDRRRIWTVLGDTVNLAARLMQLAEPGQILTDEASTERGSPRFRLDPAPRSITVKGKDQPVLPHRLSVATAESGGSVATDQPVLGRAAERSFLVERLLGAADGSGAAVLVSGPAGIGKSTLASTVGEAARAAGSTVLAGRFDLLARRESYGGLRQIIRTLLTGGKGKIGEHDIRRTVLEALLDPASDAVSEIEATPEERRTLAHSLVTELISDVSSATPHVLILDDCQWIDPASRALVADVARVCGSIPLMVLLLTRPQPLEIEVDDRLDLDELAPEAAAAVARDRLGETGDNSVLTEILDRAGGNPLFIEELADQYRETGTITSAHTLTDAVGATVDRLPVIDREALKLASVLGHTFRTERFVALAAEAGTSPPNLDGLVERSMLTEPFGGELQFRHDTLHEVAYDLLPFARRAALHEQVGDLIEQSESDRDSFLDELAYHFGRSRNVPKQRTYFRRAGDRAAELFTVETAIDYFRRLREITESDEAAYADLQLGSMLEVAGEWPGAIAALRSAAEAEDPSVRAPAQALAGRLLQSTGERAVADRLLDAAVKCELPVVERLRVLSDASLAAFEAGKIGYQVELARESLSLIGEDATLDGHRAQALARLASALAHRGDTEEARRRMAEAAELAGRAQQRRVEAIALCDLASLTTEQGHIEEASRLFARSHEIADSVADRPTTSLVLGNLSDLLLQAGRPQPALRLAQSALGQVLSLGDQVGALFLLGSCGRTLRELDRLQQSEACLSLGRAAATRTAAQSLGAAFEFELGVLAARRNAISQAQAWLRKAAERADDFEVRCRSSLWLALLAAEQEPEQAARMLDSAPEDPSTVADVAFVRYRMTSATTDRLRALDAYAAGLTLEDGPEVDRRLVELGGQPVRRSIPAEPDIAASPAGMDVLLASAARLFSLAQADNR